MICKWCGAKVEPGRKTCGRCGGQNLPLSDCGGFYDLVPNAPRGERTVPSPMPVQPPPTPMPMPMRRPARTPGWMKAMLGVLTAGVVLLGVLSLSQLGRIRDLEERDEKPSLQEPFRDPTEPGTTVPSEPVVTEPLPEQLPTEPSPSLREDLANRLEEEDRASAFVQEQLLRTEDWSIHAQQWTHSEEGPWSQGTLAENLNNTLENTVGKLPVQEENPEIEEEPTDPTEEESKDPTEEEPAEAESEPARPGEETVEAEG